MNVIGKQENKEKGALLDIYQPSFSTFNARCALLPVSWIKTLSKVFLDYKKRLLSQFSFVGFL